MRGGRGRCRSKRAASLGWLGLAVVAILFATGCNLYGDTGFRDYYVSVQGDDASGTGSQARPWRHVQYALDQIESRNRPVRLNVLPGTYAERLRVEASVVIKGAGPERTTLKNPGGEGFLITATGPGVSFRLEDVEVDGIHQSSSVSGVRADRGALRLKNVTFTKASPYGVRVSDAFLFVADDVTMDSSLWATDLGLDIDGTVAEITGFTARGSIDHVVNITDSNVEIDRADIEGSTIWYADGIRIQSPSDVEIRDSTIHRPEEAEAPEEDPHNPPYAGVEIAFASAAGRTVEIRDTQIGGFDVGIGINAEGNRVLVENSDLSGNRSAGVRTSWPATRSTAPSVDLGGGALGSAGGNTFGVGARWAVDHRGPYDVAARHNDWNVPPGRIEERIHDVADDPSVGDVVP